MMYDPTPTQCRVEPGMTNRIAMLCLAAVLGTSTIAVGQGFTKTGMTGATFLSIEVGPRAKAMGGAFVGLANDLSAIYWNPAGLTQNSKSAVMVSHSEWLADVNFDFVGAAFPIGGLGTIGASITSLSMPDQKVRTVFQPEGTGALFSASDLALGLTYAKALTDRFSIGANVKYIQNRIFNSSASTVAVDFGVLFVTDFAGTRFGASISNFGGNLSMSGTDTELEVDVAPAQFGNNDRILANLKTDSFQPPLALRVGIATDVINRTNSQLTLAIDGVVPNDNAQYVNVGGEYMMFNVLALRAGYRTLLLTDSQEGLTLGAGIDYEIFAGTNFAVDYSYSDFGVLQNVQEIALRVDF